MEAELTLPTFHPLNRDDTNDPVEKLAAVRHQCPVSRPFLEGQPPITFLTRFEDVVGVYRDYRHWGNMGVSIDVERHKSLPPEALSVIATDPPLHTRIRRMMLQAVSPTALRPHLPFIADFAREATAKLPCSTSVDVVPIWTSLIPSAAITKVMGLPQEDRAQLWQWTKGLIRAADELHGNFDYRQVLGDFLAYISQQVAGRRQVGADTDDAIGRMMSFVDPHGEQFNDREVAQHVVTLLLAGNDTTAHLLANLVRRLADDATLYARLHADRSLVPGAVEESLRLDPPQQDFPRRCLAPTVVADTSFERDDVAVLSIMSANHDETHFPAPETFDVDRDNSNDHLAFGVGIHQCVGNHLARATTTAAVNALLDRFSALRLDPSWTFHNGGYYRFWGPGDLRVILDE
jgi:cytochrome P450